MALEVSLNKELISSLNKLIAGLEKLDKTITKVDATADALAKAFNVNIFNDFLKGLKNLDKTGQDALVSLTSNFRDIIKEIGKLDVVAVRSIPALSKLIRVLTGDLKANLPGKSTLNNLAILIKDFVTDINNIGTINNATLKSIRGVADTVSAFARIAVEENVKLGNIKKFVDFIEQVRTIFEKINSLPILSQDSVTKAKTLRDFLGAFVQIERSDFGVSKRLLDNIEGIFKVFQILEKIDSLSINEQQLQKLSSLTKTLRSIASSIEIFAKDIQKVNTAGIAKKLIGITTVTTLIASVSQSLPGKGSVDELSKVFQRIGIAFANLSRAFSETDKNKGLNNKTLIKIAVSLGGLALVLKVIGSLGKFKAGGSVDTFANVTSKLATALLNLRKLNIDDAGKINSKAVLRGVRELVVIVRSLRSLKDAQLPDLDKPLKAISDFISAFNNIDDSDQRGKSRAFKNFIDDIEDALKKLSRFGTVALPNLTPLVNGFKEFNEAASLEGVTVGVNNLRDAKPIFADFLNIVEVLKLAFDGIKFLNLESQLKRVSTQILEVGSNIRQAGNDLREFGTTIIGNFGLQNLFGSDAFSKAIDFDALSSQLQVFGNLTDEELKSAQDFANQIGIDYPLSANEAIAATIDLQKAGLDLASTFNTLPAAADLAALSDSGSLETATQTIIGATKSFKEFSDGIPASFDNAAVAATLFSGAADASTASVESLSEGIANVGPTANAFGLNLTDTLAVLAQLDDAQIKGAEGGTALKSALIQLNSAAGQAELKKLGVSLTDSEGNFRDLDAVLKDLNTSLNGTKTVTTTVTNLTADQTKVLGDAQKGYSDAQAKLLTYQDQLSAGVIDQETFDKKAAQQQEILARTGEVITEVTGSVTESRRITSELTRTQQQNAKSAKILFGSYGLAAGQILLMGDGFDSYRQAILATEPANIRAQRLLDNLKGDVLQLQGSFETLITKAFLPLISRALRPVVQIGRTVVDFFLSLPDPVLEIASNVLLLASAFATFIGIVSVVAGVVISFGGALLTVLGTVTALVLNGPLLVAAIGGFIASFTALIAVVTVVGGLFIGLSTIVTRVFRAIEENSGGAGDAFAKLQRSFGRVFKSIGIFVKEFGNVFSAIFGQGDPEAFGKSLAKLFDGISNRINRLAFAIEKFARNFDFEFVAEQLNFLRRGLNLVGEGVKELFSGNQEQALRRFNFAFSNIGVAVTNVVQKLTKLDLSDALLSFRSGDFNKGIKEFGSGILGGIKKFFILNAGQIQKILLGIFNFILPGTGLARLLDILGFDGLANAIRSVLEPIQNIFKSVLGVLFSTLKGQDLETAILGNFGDAGKSIISVVKTMGKVFGNFAKIVETLVDAFFPPGTNISSGSVIEVVFKGIETAFLALDAFVLQPLLQVLPSVIDFIKNGFTSLARIAEQVVGFITRVTAPLGTLLNDLLSGGIDLETFFSSLPSALSTIFQTIVAEIPNALSSLGNFITDAFINIGELIGSPFLIQLGEQLKNGNFSGALTTVANEFVGLIGRALQLIPTLLSAGLNALGSGINSPIISLLGEQIGGGNFTGVLGTLSQAFFDVFVSALEGVGTLISTGLSTIVSGLGDKVLSRITELISTGDFLTSIGFLAGAFVGLIGQAIAKIPELISSVLGDINLPEGVAGFDVTSLTQAFVDLVSNAILGVADLLGGALEGFGIAIGSKFLEILGTQLQDAKFGEAANTVITALKDVVLSIFNSALDLLELGLPIIGKIRDDIANAKNLGDVAQAIANSLGELFGDVVSLIPKAVINLGDVFGFDLRSLVAATTIERIATAIGNIVELPISILVNAFDAITSFLSFLGKFNTIGLIALVAILAKFALIKGPALAAQLGFGQLYIALQALNGLTLTSAITAIKNFGLATYNAIKPILGVVAVLLVLKNVLDLISDIFQGRNPLEAAGEAFLQLGADALGLLGFEVDVQKIGNTLRQIVSVIIFELERLFRDAGERIQIGAQNVADTAQNSLDDAKARLEAAGGGTRFSETFFAIGGAFSGLDGQDLFNQVGFELDKAFANGETDITELIARGIRINRPALEAALSQILPVIGEVTDQEFRNITNTLFAGGALEETFTTIATTQGPAALGAFIQRLSTINPDVLAGVNFDQLSFNIVDLFNQGLLNQADAFNLIDTLLAQGTITPEQEAALKTKVTEIADRVAGLLEGAQPTDVPVQPGIEDTEGFATDATTAAQTAIDDGGQTVVVPATVELDPNNPTPLQTIEETLATQTPVTIPAAIDIDDPQTIQDNTTNLLLLQNQAVLTKDSLVQFEGQVSAVTTAIQQSGIAIQAYALIAGIGIGATTLAWLGYNSVVSFVTQDVTTNITNIQAALFTFVDQTKVKFQELADVLGDIKNSILSIGEGLPITIDISGGGPPPEGRALGGPVTPKKFYEIFDTNKPEVFEQGGKFYLLPSQAGSVTPLNAMQQTRQLAPAIAGGGGMSVVINSPVEVNVSNLPAGISAAEVGSIVDNKIRGTLNQNQDTLLRRLKRAGGQGIN